MTLRSASTPSPKAGSVAFALYRGLTTLAAPLLPIFLKRRAARGKEDLSRLSERYGIASKPRPPGTLIWIHGASVGEVLAALPLVQGLLTDKTRHVLITSGTVTSAKLLAERLPMRAFHNYVPLDTPAAVARFLDHWRPDAALFVESEFWPNLIVETGARGIPMALVNARFSERAHRGWSRMRGMAKAVLGSFDLVLAQDETVANRLADLGAHGIRITGSIKADAPLLPVNEPALKNFKRAIAGRPLFLAASTHPGEEDILFDSLAALRREQPNLLLVIVPRHPERGSAIAETATARGLETAMRSRGALPSSDTDIYIADTLGELGLFYRTTPFTYLGGSLVPHGGQNPLEPAKLGLAVLSGPHTQNFTAIFDALFAAQGMGRVADAAELIARARELLYDPALAKKLGLKARTAAEELEGALPATLAAVEMLLAQRESHHAPA